MKSLRFIWSGAWGNASTGWGAVAPLCFAPAPAALRNFHSPRCASAGFHLVDCARADKISDGSHRSRFAPLLVAFSGFVERFGRLRFLVRGFGWGASTGLGAFAPLCFAPAPAALRNFHSPRCASAGFHLVGCARADKISDGSHRSRFAPLFFALSVFEERWGRLLACSAFVGRRFALCAVSSAVLDSATYAETRSTESEKAPNTEKRSTKIEKAPNSEKRSTKIEKAIRSGAQRLRWLPSEILSARARPSPLRAAKTQRGLLKFLRAAVAGAKQSVSVAPHPVEAKQSGSVAPNQFEAPSSSREQRWAA